MHQGPRCPACRQHSLVLTPVQYLPSVSGPIAVRRWFCFVSACRYRSPWYLSGLHWPPPGRRKGGAQLSLL